MQPRQPRRERARSPWWWPDVYLQPSLRKSKAKHPIRPSVAWGAVEGRPAARDWLQQGWRSRRGRSVRHQLRELQSPENAVVLVDDSHVVEWWSGGEVERWWAASGCMGA
jgi:hypothetical protein